MFGFVSNFADMVRGSLAVDEEGRENGGDAAARNCNIAIAGKQAKLDASSDINSLLAPEPLDDAIFDNQTLPTSSSCPSFSSPYFLQNIASSPAPFPEETEEADTTSSSPCSSSASSSPSVPSANVSVARVLTQSTAAPSALSLAGAALGMLRGGKNLEANKENELRAKLR